MAIYHLSVSLISRGRGQSAVAAAAYRSGTTLRDHRVGATHRYATRRGAVHSRILAPTQAPAWARDREALWNAVEAGEVRKDAQLARLVEVSLPVELTVEERLLLLEDFIAREFVAKGMIADLFVGGDAHNPHAHIMLTLRPVTPGGFGPKERSWNGRAALVGWRSSWAARANEHLARAGHGVRIDHRTLEAQKIDLLPARRVGVARARRTEEALPGHMTDRVVEQQRIAGANGAIILEDPTVALHALTQQRPIFSAQDLEQFLRPRTGGQAQLEQAMNAVLHCPDCIALDSAAGTARFTYRDLIEAEASLMRRSSAMAARRGHGAVADPADDAGSGTAGGERQALCYLLAEGDLKALTVSDSQKGRLLSQARMAWERAGLAAWAAAPTEHAAEVLKALCAIRCASVTRWEDLWRQGEERLDKRTVFLIDGCEDIPLKPLERLLGAADNARAKAVLIADHDSIRAMRVDPPFLAVWRRVGPLSDDNRDTVA
jgi:hypothetical protein